MTNLEKARNTLKHKRLHVCCRIYPIAKLPANFQAIVSSMFKAKHLKFRRPSRGTPPLEQISTGYVTRDVLPAEEQIAYQKEATAAIQEFQEFEDKCIAETRARYELTVQLAKDLILNCTDAARADIVKLVDLLDCCKSINRMPKKQSKQLYNDIFNDTQKHVTSLAYFRDYIVTGEENVPPDTTDSKVAKRLARLDNAIRSSAFSKDRLLGVVKRHMEECGIQICYPFFTVDAELHRKSVNEHNVPTGVWDADGDIKAVYWQISNYEWGIPCYRGTPKDTSYCNIKRCPYRKRIRAAKRAAKKSAE